MTPVRALVLAFGPDADAPPRRWFALVPLPGLLLGAGLWALRRWLLAGDDRLADFGGDDE